MSRLQHALVLTSLFATQLSAQAPDPGGLFERSIADLVLPSDERDDQRVGYTTTRSESGGGSSFSFEDDEEGLYSPFAVETALRRLLGFDAQEVTVESDTGLLVARTSLGGRKRLEAQLEWLRKVEQQRIVVRVSAYRLDAWPSWTDLPGRALGASARSALTATKPWATLSCRLQDGVPASAVSLRRELEFLGDYAMNMTGIRPTLNPEQCRFREGLWAGLTCSRMPSGPGAVLEFQLGVAHHEGEERIEWRPGLPLVLPSWSQLEAQGSCAVQGKQTVLLAAAHDPGVGKGKVLLITAELAEIPARLPAPDQAVVLRRYAWGALDRDQPEEDSYLSPGLSLPATTGDVHRNRGQLEEFVQLDLVPERWTDETFVVEGPNGLIVCQTGAIQDQVASYLQKTYASRASSLSQSVEIQTGTETAQRLSVASCAGREAGLSWQRLRKLLSGVERSAGSSSVRFEDPGDDPVVEIHAHGTLFRARGSTCAGGLRVALELKRHTLGKGTVTAQSAYGAAQRPTPGWRWHLEKAVQINGKPVVAGELTAPGRPLTTVTLRSSKKGSK